MGISNIRAGTDDKLARLRGELAAKRAELQCIEESVQRISALHQEMAELNRAIEGGETFLKFVCPDWQPSKTKPIRPNVHRGPFAFGERGKIALEILRDATEGMTAREIAKQALVQIGFDTSDRAELDKQANSLSNYLKKHHGDLVESDGGYPQKWRVIR